MLNLQCWAGDNLPIDRTVVSKFPFTSNYNLVQLGAELGKFSLQNGFFSLLPPQKRKKNHHPLLLTSYSMHLCIQNKVGEKNAIHTNAL